MPYRGRQRNEIDEELKAIRAHGIGGHHVNGHVYAEGGKKIETIIKNGEAVKIETGVTEPVLNNFFQHPAPLYV